MRIPGWAWIAYHRAANRLLDLRAVLAGACNESTWDGSTYGNGYAHWRCMKRRGHTEAHRYNNYIWLGGSAEYVPLNGVSSWWKEELPYSKVTRRRYPTMPRRRQRLQRRWWEEQTRQRRVRERKSA